LIAHRFSCTLLQQCDSFVDKPMVLCFDTGRRTLWKLWSVSDCAS